MAFQPAPGCAEAIIQYEQADKLCVMTFYGVRVGGYTFGQIGDLATAMDVWALGEFRPLVSNGVRYIQTVVTGLENINDFQVVNATSTGVGALGSDPMPNNVAFCVKRVTGLTGRSARGRVYWPVAEAQQNASDTNRASDTFVSNVVAASNEVRDAMLAAGWIECIVSRQTEGVKREEAAAFAITDYVAADNRLDSMRSRMPKL